MRCKAGAGRILIERVVVVPVNVRAVGVGVAQHIGEQINNRVLIVGFIV